MRYLTIEQSPAMGEVKAVVGGSKSYPGKQEVCS
jgi:hypothetical protein